MAKQFRHIVTVTGKGSFPIDMLRYDRLTPSSETDSGKIIRTLDRVHILTNAVTIPFSSEEDQVIELYKLDHKAWKPQHLRWQSFTWKVIDHKVEPLI